jgi:hypothetical protein
MDHTDKEHAILQIVQGQYFVDLRDKLLIYREPDLNLLWLSVYEYRKFYQKYQDNGAFLTQQEANNLLEEEGIWDQDDQKTLKDLEENLLKLKKGRSEFRYQSKKLAAIDNTIEETMRHINKLDARKNTFFTQTIEYQARQSQRYWLLSKSIFDTNLKLYWDSFDELEQDYDVDFINELVIKVFYEGLFDTKTIRMLAREEPWRTRWKAACKFGTSPFSNEHMTNTQYYLVYWSSVYDSVYESMDCPSQSVIDDDAALDSWFEEQAHKRDSDSGVSSDSPVSSKKIAESQEVFIPVDSPSDAAKVYNDLNTVQAKNIFKSRQEAIKQHGKLAEGQLPDVAQDLSIRKTQLERRKIMSK